MKLIVVTVNLKDAVCQRLDGDLARLGYHSSTPAHNSVCEKTKRPLEFSTMLVQYTPGSGSMFKSEITFLMCFQSKLSAYK